MRARPFVVGSVILGVVAQTAVAQQREDLAGAVSRTSTAASSVTTPVASATEPELPAGDLAQRDACAEVLHAVQFEDESGAVGAYARCRERVAPNGSIPSADAVRTLEDVTEALHSLRREDGAFCIEPSAPFDFHTLLAGVGDTRACLLALDRLLASDNAIWRFVLADEYASGRLAARGHFDIAVARRNRLRPPNDSPAERELIAIARLLGRHFMRTCRCLPGPQPDTITAVRAMALPSTIERVLLASLQDREGGHLEP